MVVLEQDSSLNTSIPEIITGEWGRNNYQLPSTITYPFWFDIITTDTIVNKVLANFKIDVNEQGRRLLKDKGIPTMFPAVTLHEPVGNKDYNFYYFSADFCDNPVSQFSSYFKGIHHLSFLFYNRFDKADRQQFFWKYYQPLLSNIMSRQDARVN